MKNNILVRNFYNTKSVYSITPGRSSLKREENDGDEVLDVDGYFAKINGYFIVFYKKEDKYLQIDNEVFKIETGVTKLTIKKQWPYLVGELFAGGRAISINEFAPIKLFTHSFDPASDLIDLEIDFFIFRLLGFIENEYAGIRKR